LGQRRSDSGELRRGYLESLVCQAEDLRVLCGVAWRGRRGSWGCCDYLAGVPDCGRADVGDVPAPAAIQLQDCEDSCVGMFLGVRTGMTGNSPRPAHAAGRRPCRAHRQTDLGVWHHDGYVELRDRAQDIIVSGGGKGGENIATIEVEADPYPGVLEVPVVGVPSRTRNRVSCRGLRGAPGAAPTGRADHRGRRSADRPLQRALPGRAGRVAAQDVVWQYRKVEPREAEWSGHRNRVPG
jgi:hypothetical protein